MKWYKDEITFLVDKDSYFIEVVVLRTSWVTKLPYEVSKDECMSITNIILNMPECRNIQHI